MSPKDDDHGASRRVKLDKVDRRILRDLQDNGRMTNVELAKLAQISAPRVCAGRALEDAGSSASSCRKSTPCAWATRCCLRAGRASTARPIRATRSDPDARGPSAECNMCRGWLSAQIVARIPRTSTIVTTK